MGAAHGINVATIDAYKRGVLTTTNVIVPGPWFLEAARLLKENPGLDVGVHLALTSEWDERQVASADLRAVARRSRRLFLPDGPAAARVRRRRPASRRAPGRSTRSNASCARSYAGEAAHAAGDLHLEPHGLHLGVARTSRRSCCG